MPPLTAAKGTVQDRKRLANALLIAARGFVVSAAKTFYALWLQMTGLLFAVLGVAGVSALLKQYHADHFADHKRLAIVGAFTLICVWFTVFSFLKARRTRVR